MTENDKILINVFIDNEAPEEITYRAVDKNDEA